MGVFLENWPVVVAGCFTLLVLLGLFVSAAVQYFMNLKYSLKTWRWALIYILAAAPLPIINTVMVFMKPASELPNPQQAGFLRVGAVLGLFIGLGIAVAAGLVFTASGLYNSRRMRLPGYPLFRGVARAGRRIAGRARSFPWVPTLVAGGGFLVYTALLFAATRPRVSPVLQKAMQTWEGLMKQSSSPVLAAVLVSLIAVKEEVTYRLFMQTQLEWWMRGREHAGALAILVTSTLWTLGHAGALEPNWVKFVQIFPMGIVLGIMRRRWGLAPCMLAHLVLNLVGVVALKGLVGGT
jgi:membrane protease YdiL (CAAX protease family)